MPDTKHTRLDEKWTKPRVAVLDDKEGEVRPLIDHLEGNDYHVDYYPKRDAFVAAVRDLVYPIQLIDMQLGGHSDRDGLAVVAECARLHPEALRICISTVLGTVPVLDFLDALKPRDDIIAPLCLSAALGVRNLWAIYDKNTEIVKLRKLIERFRQTVGSGDDTEVWVDAALLADFRTGFRSLRWGQYGASQLPQVQVVEIVRQLARRPGLPPVKKITLTKLGKGRSRTVVAHMTIEFEAPAGTRGRAAVPKVRQSIVKIGREGSIKREVENYSQFLPQIFGSTFYPNIEATGVSLALAGVAYSCLSDTDTGVAPTLLDALYDQVPGIDAAEAAGQLRKAFIYKHQGELEVDARHGQGKRLWNKYVERFGTLQQAADKALDPVLAAANDRLADLGVLAGPPGHRTLRYAGRALQVGDAVEQLVKPASFEDFYIDLSHGDMHLDNILLVRQGKETWTNFYIDFADAGPHHVMLDFVVMDTAVRFQSLKYLAEPLTAATGDELVVALCAAEAALLAGDPPPRPALPPRLADWLDRTTTILREVRAQAEAYLTGVFRASLAAPAGDEKAGRGRRAKGRAPDRPRAGPAPDDEVEKERYRFRCGVGLAALSALPLDQTQPDQNLMAVHRAWFAYVCQLNLTTFNLWRQATEVAG